MSDSGIDRLSQKLQAGKNERQHGYEKYMTAKFYKNLTQSQYQGSITDTDTMKAVSENSLNPAANLARMKLRLSQTQAIAARYTPEQANWVRYALERVGNKVWRFKFNYLIKFFFIY